MLEKRAQSTYSTRTLARGDVPRSVLAMATHPEVRGHLVALHASGASVSLRQLVSTPDQMRALVHGYTNVNEALGYAMRPPRAGEAPAISQMREMADRALVFSASNASGSPLTERQQDILIHLNTHPFVAERRRKVASTRLRQDRPHQVRRRFQFAGSVIGAAVGLTEASELFLGKVGETIGLVVAQSTDDVMNTYIVPGTENGGAKKLPQIMKESKALLPVLVAAGAADYLIIPQLLESPSMTARMMGGVLFSAAAVGGSLGANILHLYRTHQEEKKKKEEISSLQRLKKSWKDHISDPFRKAIWGGASASLVAATGTAIAKVLAGKDWSGVIELAIGMTESTPAFMGLLLAGPSEKAKNGVKDWLMVHRAKEPIQIFPE